MLTDSLIQAHRTDDVQDLALHRNRLPELTDAEFRYLLQQVEGYQRLRHKIPSLADRWHFPVRLSCEQCSSELTARYKASLVRGQRLIDLTGGAGVDTYFLSANFAEADYIEQDSDLCLLAQHNLPSHVRIHCTTAEAFLAQAATNKPAETVCYIDPARRDKNGGKVFRIADCTPNLIEILPAMRAMADTVLIKLSPMLDITDALRTLGGTWQVHVVAVKDEVKEVLLLSTQPDAPDACLFTAVDMADNSTFSFLRKDEDTCPVTYATTIGTYLYEPNAAILKAGAYKMVGHRFGLNKLAPNTHLYTADTLLTDFPGRIFRVLQPIAKNRPEGTQYNVLTRNYPLSPEQIKRKWHIADGGTQYIIGTRTREQAVLLLAERLA